MNKPPRYYTTLQDDFYPPTDYTLPEDYRWVRTDPLSRLLSAVIYGAALVFSTVYCRLFLHLHIVGAGKLRAVKGGFFLYGNHTQPIGDVFHPALACFPKRIYTVVSPANYALPVIGKLLPYLGALPLTDSLRGMKQFGAAVAGRLAQGHPIVVYPEAHVWDYYTDIRPFADASFKLPLKHGVPVYAMTTTYQKRRWGRRPRITLYIDGPFAAAGDGPRQQATALRDAVYACMKERSRASNCAYIEYIQHD